MTDDQLYFAFAIVVLLAFNILTWVQLSETKRDLHSLNREMNDKVSEMRFGWEQEKVRDLSSKTAAIERHLNIEIVKEPARLTIKDRQCPSGS